MGIETLLSLNWGESNKPLSDNIAATALLKSTLLESTRCEAVFYCDHGTIKINSGFHCPSTVTLIKEVSEEIIDFNCKKHGYIYEISHFNELLRQEKKKVI